MKTHWVIIAIIAITIIPLYTTIIIVNYLKYRQFVKLNQKLQLESDAKMYYYWFYNPELKGIYKKRYIEIKPVYERRGKTVFTFYEIEVQTFLKDSINLIIGGKFTANSDKTANMKAIPVECKHQNMVKK